MLCFDGRCIHFSVMKLSCIMIICFDRRCIHFGVMKLSCFCCVFTVIQTWYNFTYWYCNADWVWLYILGCRGVVFLYVIWHCLLKSCLCSIPLCCSNLSLKWHDGESMERTQRFLHVHATHAQGRGWCHLDWLWGPCQLQWNLHDTKWQKLSQLCPKRN